MNFYAGTLTREGGEGVLVCSLEENRLKKKSVYTEIVDPTYMILSKDRKHLFAVSSDRQDAAMNGCLVEFEINGKELVKQAVQFTDGIGPCHLTFDAEERYLYVPNYFTGSLCVFPHGEHIQPMCQLIQLAGKGPHPTRQTGPHPHQATFIPGTCYLTVCDLGTDELRIYKQDSVSGKLTVHGVTKLHGGPRHVIYGEAGTLWLVHELSNKVTALKEENNELVVLQTLPTIPDEYQEKNTAAAIRLSKDGKQLYVSNRGHGSIAVYDVGVNRTLDFIKWIPAGQFPRDFIVLDDGRFLIADQYNGIWLESPDGEVLDFLPEKGAVCICTDQGDHEE